MIINGGIPWYMVYHIFRHIHILLSMSCFGASIWSRAGAWLQVHRRRGFCKIRGEQGSCGAGETNSSRKLWQYSTELWTTYLPWLVGFYVDLYYLIFWRITTHRDNYQPSSIMRCASWSLAILGRFGGWSYNTCLPWHRWLRICHSNWMVDGIWRLMVGGLWSLMSGYYPDCRWILPQSVSVCSDRL